MPRYREPIDADEADAQLAKLAKRAELDAALKAHFKRNERRSFVALPAIAGLMLACWLFDLNGTQMGIGMLGVLVLVVGIEIERRLKTMQVKLAYIHDQLEHGHYPGEHALTELSDW